MFRVMFAKAVFKTFVKVTTLCEFGRVMSNAGGQRAVGQRNVTRATIAHSNVTRGWGPPRVTSSNRVTPE